MLELQFERNVDRHNQIQGQKQMSKITEVTKIVTEFQNISLVEKVIHVNTVQYIYDKYKQGMR